MDDATRAGLIKTGWEVHGLVEDALLRHPAVKGSGADWLDKQRLLLADMAMHLMQTALKPGEIELDKLRNSLHAILAISDQFLPHAELKDATSRIYRDTGEPRL